MRNFITGCDYFFIRNTCEYFIMTKHLYKNTEPLERYFNAFYRKKRHKGIRRKILNQITERLGKTAF